MTALLTILILLCTFSTFAFAETVDGQWHAGIGDPTVFGWLTVVFYIVASYVCFKQYRQLQQAGVATKFWLYLAIMLLLLGINKQLDLQSLFTQVLRSHALANGWYAQRGVFQAVFIVLLGVGLLAALLSLRLLLSKSWHQYKLAWLGSTLLCTFVLMRAASFHNFDSLINVTFFGLRVNVALELGTIVVIMVAALKQYNVDDALQVAASNRQYVEMQTDQDLLECPACTFQPSSKPVDGRRFKCKECGHKYTVFITG